MDARVKAFKESAERYCAAIESLPHQPQREAMQTALIAVAELFYLGLQIPSVEPTDMDWPDLVGSKERDYLRRHISELFSEKDIYWEVFDRPRIPPEEPIAGSLSDDLADIWFDLKRELLTLKSNPESLADVQWSWRFSQETHWGRHALSAVSTLHQLLYS